MKHERNRLVLAGLAGRVFGATATNLWAASLVDIGRRRGGDGGHGNGGTVKALGRLRPFVAPYWASLSGGFVSFFLARLFEISTYFLLAKGIDLVASQLADGPNAMWHVGVLDADLGLGTIVIWMTLFVLGRFFAWSHARRAMRRVSIAISYDLRQKVYAVVQRQGPRFFSRMGVGDIMTRAIQDIALVQKLFSMGMIQLVVIVYAPLFGMTAMMIKSPSLTMLIFPFLPAVFVYAWRMARRMAESSREVQQGLSDLTSHTQENLSGIRTVQAMAQEQNEIARFWRTNDDYAKAFYEQSRLSSWMSAVKPYIAHVAQLGIICYGGHLVMIGEMTIGDLVFFLTCLNMLLQPIRMAGFFITTVQRAVVGTERLYEIFDAVPEIVDAPSGATPALIRGDFKLQGLTFSYPGTDAPTLKDINLHVHAGESVGIVGRIGSGKSTLLKQLTRMLDTPRGTVLLDGHDVCDYSLISLRGQVAQVLQDPFLFGEPLRQNISYDDTARQMTEVWDSADAAALRDTIEDLPHQMETLVGERGVTLSGGQKQRATLARGLIRDAPVLILDDCFSSVDTATEEHILGRLKSMRNSRTTILVSHRVSTLRHCDRIVVLEDGAVAEVGSHEELLRAGGIYAALERAQAPGAANGGNLVPSPA